MLGATDWGGRATAVRAVGALGSAAATEEILGHLARLLGDKDWRREAAADAVGALGSAAATPEILSHLARMLGDEYGWVRREAAAVVGKLGSGAATSEILRHLARLLGDENGYVRPAAAAAVGRFHKQGLRIFAQPAWNGRVAYAALSVNELREGKRPGFAPKA